MSNCCELADLMRSQSGLPRVGVRIEALARMGFSASDDSPMFEKPCEYGSLCYLRRADSELYDFFGLRLSNSTYVEARERGAGMPSSHAPRRGTHKNK